MKPSTYVPILEATASSPADTTTVMTLTPPAGTSACLLSVETTSVRLTLDNSTPAAGNGHIWPKDLAPQLVLIGSGAVIKWIALTAAISRVNVTWLT